MQGKHASFTLQASRRPITIEEGSERMRLASGEVRSDEPLVKFLYLLGRNQLALGVIEELMVEVEGSYDEALYCNGWLAEWAKYTAARLLAPVVPTTTE